MVKKYDVKIYKKDGREGPTVRGLTYCQRFTLEIALEEHDIKHTVKDFCVQSNPLIEGLGEGLEVLKEV